MRLTVAIARCRDGQGLQGVCKESSWLAEARFRPCTGQRASCRKSTSRLGVHLSASHPQHPVPVAIPPAVRQRENGTRTVMAHMRHCWTLRRAWFLPPWADPPVVFQQLSALHVRHPGTIIDH